MNEVLIVVISTVGAIIVALLGIIGNRLLKKMELSVSVIDQTNSQNAEIGKLRIKRETLIDARTEELDSFVLFLGVVNAIDNPEVASELSKLTTNRAVTTSQIKAVEKEMMDVYERRLK